MWTMRCFTCVRKFTLSWVDLSKQPAFIAQLIAVHEFVQSVLEDIQWWSINDLLWQQIPAIHNSLAEEAHSALFQWSVFVQLVVMSSKVTQTMESAWKFLSEKRPTPACRESHLTWKGRFLWALSCHSRQTILMSMLHSGMHLIWNKVNKQNCKTWFIHCVSKK